MSTIATLPLVTASLILGLVARRGCGGVCYVSFFQFLRNFRYQNAFEQTELILWAALDPAIARRARRGEFVRSLDHFDLLQTAIN